MVTKLCTFAMDNSAVWISLCCDQSLLWCLKCEVRQVQAMQKSVSFGETTEFFLNCQIWHFCHSCTKLTSQGFKISKKIASTGYWAHNTNPTIRIPAPLPTQPICQSMPASNFQTLLKSCSIKPEMIKVQFMNLLFNRCLGGWVVKGAGNLRVGLVLWVPYPVEVIFFLLILKPRDVNFVQEWQKCQIWQLRKNSNLLLWLSPTY